MHETNQRDVSSCNHGSPIMIILDTALWEAKNQQAWAVKDFWGVLFLTYTWHSSLSAATPASTGGVAWICAQSFATKETRIFLRKNYLAFQNSWKSLPSKKGSVCDSALCSLKWHLWANLFSNMSWLEAATKRQKMWDGARGLQRVLTWKKHLRRTAFARLLTLLQATGAKAPEDLRMLNFKVSATISSWALLKTRGCGSPCQPSHEACQFFWVGPTVNRLRFQTVNWSSGQRSKD